MLATVGVLESILEREPWNDESRPIYERLQMKRQAQKEGEMSDSVLEQLSSQRDSASLENMDNPGTADVRGRRASIKNFFSGMELTDLSDKTPQKGAHDFVA